MSTSEAAIQLERYCYIGDFNLVYSRKTHLIKVDEVFEKINAIIQIIDVDVYLKIVEKCLKNGNLPRHDELWFTYVLMMMNNSLPDAGKIKLKESFVKFAKSSDDLFMFSRYAFNTNVYQKRKNLARPIKKAIKLWYEKQNPTKLAEILSECRSKERATHENLIRCCHINLKKMNKGDLEKFIFKSCTKFVKDNQGESNLTKLSETFNNISISRTTTDLNVIKHMLEQNKIDYNNVQTHALTNSNIWEILIPTLSFRVLVKSVHFLIEKKVMTQELSKMYVAALNNRELMRKEKIHPIFFLIERNKQIKGMRYSERIKQTYYARRLKRLQIKRNPTINNKLSILFETSFNNLESLGLRIFITINLQENYKKKPVVHQRQLSCMEAAVTLAFAYFKSAKKAAAYSYGVENSKLLPIPWTKNLNYKNAFDTCDKLVNKKNAQKSFLPIAEAVTKPDPYDLFLIIVPSAARSNSHMKSNKVVDMLESYRKAKNHKARMVFVNLRRFKAAMTPQATLSKNGVLEICAFDENVPKLINAFVLNQFS